MRLCSAIIRDTEIVYRSWECILPRGHSGHHRTIVTFRRGRSSIHARVEWPGRVRRGNKDA